MAELRPEQRKALSELEKSSSEAKIHEIRWDREFKSPKLISGTLSAPSGDDPETIARRFLERVAGLVELPQGVEERLELSNIVTDFQNYKHLSFQQYLNGVPVFEGSIQVHINPNGQVVNYKANRATEIDVSMTPTIPPVRAVEMASKELGETESQKFPPKTELVLFKDSAGRMHLTWRVKLFSDRDLVSYNFFVDAHTGALLYRYGEFRHIMARETYTADNEQSIPGRVLIREGDTSHIDQVAWDAHRNAGIVYNYYGEHFNRDSYDDLGSRLRSTVHFSRNYNNAFWSPDLQQMIYGDGDGIQFSPLSGDLDVVAHELTHGVTSNTARFVYAEEAGALDESFADFFGIMVTNGDTVTNWLMGEHSYTPGRPGDALRDVSNPARFGQPDHTDNQRRLAPGEMPICYNIPGYNDNGYVHTNSGIPNKAAYLMVAGGTHRGITVEPLGKAAAEKLLYLALTAYLQSAIESRWTFWQARLASIEACRQLFPGDEAKAASVMNAWAAVGVGEPAAPLPSDDLFRIEANPRLDIPDANPTGVTSVLTVPRAGRIKGIKVSVEIPHTYIGDLQVTLTAPDGTAVLLHEREGASAKNLEKSYTERDKLAPILGKEAQGNWTLKVADIVKVDVGRLHRWILEIGLEESSAPGVVRAEATPALSIPDNNPNGVKSAIEISQPGTAKGIKASVDITHTWIGDLLVELIAPSGQVAVLHSPDPSESQDNLIATYDSTSNSLLAALVNQPVQGNWVLSVKDLAGRDVGKLNKWSLEISL